MPMSLKHRFGWDILLTRFSTVLDWRGQIFAAPIFRMRI
jgi:hypothetical protein